MLFDVLDRIRQQTIISSILLMIVGLLMLIVPIRHDEVLVELLGYVILVIGGVMVLDFIAGSKKISDYIAFLAALLLILLGIFILVSGADILVILSVVFGILLLVDGIHSSFHAWWYARRAGRRLWWVLLILSISLIIAGIIIFNNPWLGSGHSLVKVIGAVLLYGAAVGIVRLIMVWPIRRTEK